MWVGTNVTLLEEDGPLDPRLWLLMWVVVTVTVAYVDVARQRLAQAAAREMEARRELAAVRLKLLESRRMIRLLLRHVELLHREDAHAPNSLV